MTFYVVNNLCYKMFLEIMSYLIPFFLIIFTIQAEYIKLLNFP